MACVERGARRPQYGGRRETGKGPPPREGSWGELQVCAVGPQAAAETTKGRVMCNVRKRSASGIPQKARKCHHSAGTLYKCWTQRPKVSVPYSRGRLSSRGSEGACGAGRKISASRDRESRLGADSNPWPSAHWRAGLTRCAKETPRPALGERVWSHCWAEPLVPCRPPLWTPNLGNRGRGVHAACWSRLKPVCWVIPNTMGRRTVLLLHWPCSTATSEASAADTPGAPTPEGLSPLGQQRLNSPQAPVITLLRLHRWLPCPHCTAVGGAGAGVGGRDWYQQTRRGGKEPGSLARGRGPYREALGGFGQMKLAGGFCFVLASELRGREGRTETEQERGQHRRL